jgi:dephospho-CoA kinase
MQVVVADLADANPLGAVDFVEFTPVSDHRPPGVESARDGWQKRLFQSGDDERAANIHVRFEGRPNARYALLFRDYLRAHSVAAAAYAELKRRLAAELRGLGPYTETKDAACDLIVVAAEDWAAATGWEPGPTDA